MKRTLCPMLTCLAMWSAAGFSCSQWASAQQTPADVARRLDEITDTVLQHHIDPPARQQMILGGLKALYETSARPVPAGLSRRVSSLATREQLGALLVEVWPQAPAKASSADGLADAVFRGAMSTLAGGAYLISAKERKVADQVEGNRYVGIQIALTMDDDEKLTWIAELFEGGPADRAGAKAGDRIEKINGIKTNGMNLRDVVDRLRGDEGTDVLVTVRQPKSRESRTLKMTRAALPRTTVRGLRKRSSGGWDVRIDGSDAVGYLRISEISASTPHELRNLARQLENEGARSIVLDLRSLSGSLVHPTVVLADSLLDHGAIGRVKTVEREMTYEADSDALFPGWPMAVLIDDFTRGTAEWLAAALQDNHRSTVVGTPTRGALGAPTADVRSNQTVADGTWSINLVTGYLEHGDGRPLSRVSPSSPSLDPNDGVRRIRSADEKPNGGVRQDHPAARNPTDTPAQPQIGSLRLSDDHDLSNDVTLRKAIELLRVPRKKA
jgi:C-terminal peptidase prc